MTVPLKRTETSTGPYAPLELPTAAGIVAGVQEYVTSCPGNATGASVLRTMDVEDLIWNPADATTVPVVGALLLAEGRDVRTSTFRV